MGKKVRSREGEKKGLENRGPCGGDLSRLCSLGAWLEGRCSRCRVSSPTPAQRLERYLLQAPDSQWLDPNNSRPWFPITLLFARLGVMIPQVWILNSVHQVDPEPLSASAGWSQREVGQGSLRVRCHSLRSTGCVHEPRKWSALGWKECLSMYICSPLSVGDTFQEPQRMPKIAQVPNAVYNFSYTYIHMIKFHL